MTIAWVIVDSLSVSPDALDREGMEEERDKAVLMSYRLVFITPETRSKDWPTSQPKKTG